MDTCRRFAPEVQAAKAPVLFWVNRDRDGTVGFMVRCRNIIPPSWANHDFSLGDILELFHIGYWILWKFPKNYWNISSLIILELLVKQCISRLNVRALVRRYKSCTRLAPSGQSTTGWVHSGLWHDTETWLLQDGKNENLRDNLLTPDRADWITFSSTESL